MRLKFLSVFSLWILAVSPMQAGVDPYLRTLLGPRGYHENELGATLNFPWTRSPEALKGGTVSGWWLGSALTTYDAEHLSRSYRTSVNGGLELGERLSLDLEGWIMPKPNDQTGAYSAEGVDSTVAYWGPGFLPGFSSKSDSEADLRSEIGLTFGYTRHEELLGLPGTENPFDDNPGRQNRGSGSLAFVAPTLAARSQGADDGTNGGTTSAIGPSLNTLRIGETRAGVKLTERFGKSLALRGSGEVHHYDQDLSSLASQLSIFTVLNAENAAALELLNGFSGNAWGLGADLKPVSVMKLSADYRHTNYVLGIAPDADTYSARLSLYLGRITVRPLYEIFKLRGRPASSYYGLTLAASF